MYRQSVPWLLSLWLAAAAAASPAHGATRIVSLVPSLTEAVCLMHACERLVGVDRHSNWPASVRALPQLGGLDDTPVEALAALRPDLVLLAPSSRLIARLGDLGIPTLALPTQTHEDIRQAMKAIGARLGRSARAEQLWHQAQAQLDQAARGVPQSVRGLRVYIEVSSEPHAAGPGSFIGQTLERLGLANIAPRDLGPFPRLNPEFVVREQPDLIIAPRQFFDLMPARAGWTAMRALSNVACRIEAADWEVVVRPGPRLGQAAEVLARCLSRAAPGRQPAPPPGSGSTAGQS